VSISRKQVLNASVTACSSSIGRAAANGDRAGWASAGRARGRERERMWVPCAMRRDADAVDVDVGPLGGRGGGG